MDSHSTGPIIAMIVLVILSGYFSATETAFTSLNRIKVKNLANDGNKRAARVLKLSDNYDKLLTSILIGNNIVNILLTVVATVFFIRIYGDMGATAATVFTTVVVLIFGEITPKSLAKESPESFSLFASGFIGALTVIFTPINWLFSQWKKLIVKVFHVSGNSNFTEEELKTLVEEAETEGTLESDQSELIQNAIGFYELNAEDVMTPRPDIKAIETDCSKEEIAALFRDTGFSRMPVYEDDLDNILGFLNQKDFHNHIISNSNVNIMDYVKPTVFVAETIKISVLLKKMQALQTHIAIVVDEYGGTSGLVTMEDIIEELVGEIYDEHDVIMNQEVTELKNGSFRVQCNASLAKVFDFFGLDDDDEDANTVNGWVVECLDKLPEKDDTFQYINGNKMVRGRVTKATPRKALEVNLTIEDIPEADKEEE